MGILIRKHTHTHTHTQRAKWTHYETHTKKKSEQNGHIRKRTHTQIREKIDIIISKHIYKKKQRKKEREKRKIDIIMGHI